MVFFVSSIKPQSRHLILPNTNSPQYNLAYSKPTPLPTEILYTYQATCSDATPSTPTLSPAPTPVLNNTRNNRVSMVHNKRVESPLLLPPGCNLRA